MEEDVKNISKWVKRDLLSLFGNTFADSFDDEQEPPSAAVMRGERTFFVISLKYDVDMGVFKSIIENVFISVYFEGNIKQTLDNEDVEYWVEVTLSYDHPGGGSNGYHIVSLWYSKDGKLVSHRK